MTKLNQKGEPIDDSTSNPDGDEVEDEDELDFLTEEEQEKKRLQAEEDKKALEIYNKRVGKEYKSWDDVKKSERQRDIDFAKNPPKKEDPKPEPNEVKKDFTVSERLLKLENKDYGESVMAGIISEIKSDHPDKDPLQVWESYEFYRKEAKARAEVEAKKERIKNPSGNGGENKKEDATSDYYMDPNRLPPGFKFTPKK